MTGLPSPHSDQCFSVVGISWLVWQDDKQPKKIDEKLNKRMNTNIQTVHMLLTEGKFITQ